MFIAHLPAGYLLSKTLARRRPAGPGWIAVGMVGAVFPDLDLLYFYLLDGRQHAHHSYWTHKPFYWAVLSVVLVGAAWALRSQRLERFCLFFLPNVFGHLILDTWVGHIRWLSPLSERSFALIEVPAVHEWWVLNFVLHPTFLLEVVIVVAAVVTALATSSRSEPRQSRVPEPRLARF